MVRARAGRHAPMEIHLVHRDPSGALLVVAMTLGFLVADLGMARGAASQIVSDLEKYLGVQLLPQSLSD